MAGERPALQGTQHGDDANSRQGTANYAPSPVSCGFKYALTAAGPLCWTCAGTRCTAAAGAAAVSSARAAMAGSRGMNARWLRDSCEVGRSVLRPVGQLWAGVALLKVRAKQRRPSYCCSKPPELWLLAMTEADKERLPKYVASRALLPMQQGPPPARV